MPIITWTPSISVSVAEFDAQHKKLIDYINELFDAMKVGKANDVVGKILANLITYTKLHFANEEKNMVKFSYPEYAQHKAEHDALTSKVIEFQDKFNRGQVTVSIELMNFLKEWLTKHITGTDKKYGPFFNQNGLN